MTDEIFGPVLPLVAVSSRDDAIAFVNARPKPLALYLFAHSSRASAEVLGRTSSGGVCINDTLMQISNGHLPFGGVGESGMGSYHGIAGFDALSHRKAVYVAPGTFPIDSAALRFPPYNDSRAPLLSWLVGLAPLYAPGFRDILIIGLATAVAVLATRVAGGGNSWGR